MKQALLFLFSLIFIAANARDITGTAIVLGHTDSIQSKILNEKRTIWIYLPFGAGTPANAGLRYPVVYVFDGPAHFAAVSGMIQYLSEANGKLDILMVQK